KWCQEDRLRDHPPASSSTLTEGRRILPVAMLDPASMRIIRIRQIKAQPQKRPHASLLSKKGPRKAFEPLNGGVIAVAWGLGPRTLPPAPRAFRTVFQLEVSSQRKRPRTTLPAPDAGRIRD